MRLIRHLALTLPLRSIECMVWLMCAAVILCMVYSLNKLHTQYQREKYATLDSHAEGRRVLSLYKLHRYQQEVDSSAAKLPDMTRDYVANDNNRDRWSPAMERAIRWGRIEDNSDLEDDPEDRDKEEGNAKMLDEIDGYNYFVVWEEEKIQVDTQSILDKSHNVAHDGEFDRERRVPEQTDMDHATRSDTHWTDNALIQPQQGKAVQNIVQVRRSRRKQKTGQIDQLQTGSDDNKAESAHVIKTGQIDQWQAGSDNNKAESAHVIKDSFINMSRIIPAENQPESVQSKPSEGKSAERTNVNMQVKRNEAQTSKKQADPSDLRLKDGSKLDMVKTASNTDTQSGVDKNRLNNLNRKYTDSVANDTTHKRSYSGKRQKKTKRKQLNRDVNNKPKSTENLHYKQALKRQEDLHKIGAKVTHESGGAGVQHIIRRSLENNITKLSQQSSQQHFGYKRQRHKNESNSIPQSVQTYINGIKDDKLLSSHHHHRLYIEMRGRLGNNMFQFASLYSIARALNRTPVISDTYELFDAFHKNIKNSVLVGQPDAEATQVSETNGGMYSSRLYHLPPRDIQICCYLQSWKYFVDYSDELRSLFQFKEWIQIRAQGIIKAATTEYRTNNKLSRYNTQLTYIGVHIRRTDVIEQRHLHRGYKPASLTYLQRAMDYFRQKYPSVYFIVCSDNTAWSREYLSDSDVYVTEANQDGMVDLAVLSMCNHTVITVGTFSWWAGWLAGGDVVYYNNWPTPGTEISATYNHEDYFMPHWKPFGD